jgi:hypothetical protein
MLDPIVRNKHILAAMLLDLTEQFYDISNSLLPPPTPPKKERKSSVASLYFVYLKLLVHLGK